MSRIPNFSDIAFADTASAAPVEPAPSHVEPWQTPEGIAVKAAYAARRSRWT